MKKLNSKNIFTKHNMKNVFDALLVVCGTFLMGLAFNVFLNNYKISPSGFSGLSAIISNVLAEHLNIHISSSIFYLAINGVLFIFAYKNLGLKFAINSAIGIISYSIFMEVVNFSIDIPQTERLLCAIYRGVIMGLGLGLVFRGKGSTGGSDMLANLLSKKFKFITVGNMVFVVDFIVVVLSFIAYKELQLALFSLISIWIMTKMTDIIISGASSLRAYYIISANYGIIADAIIKEADRGVTGIKSVGMYTKKEQNMLMTIVTRSEAVKLRQIVATLDKNAFMFSSPVSEAMGVGFMPLDSSKKNKKSHTEEETKQTKNIVDLDKNIAIVEDSEQIEE